MKFSIRDLLLVTMVIGMFFAWSMDHRNMEAEIQRLADEHQEKVRLLLAASAALQRENELLQKETKQLRWEEARRKHAEQGGVGLYWP